MIREYRVVEIFGPTIEGEGDLIGSVCHFVRFGGCDFRCSWCDSGYAVLPKDIKENSEWLTAEQILNRLRGLPGRPSWVIFSGGNPALQRNLDWLIDQLNFQNVSVNVETQGTIFRPWLNKVQMVTVSPKPPSSGNTIWPEQVQTFVSQLTTKKVLKVVVFNGRDLEYAREIHRAFPKVPFYISCGTVAGGLHGAGYRESRGTTLERLKTLAESIIIDPIFGDVRILPQLHVLLWGHDQGH